MSDQPTAANPASERISMDPSNSQLMMPTAFRPWPFSAVESYVLLYGIPEDGSYLLKQALLELVARHYLWVVRADGTSRFLPRPNCPILLHYDPHPYTKRHRTQATPPPTLRPGLAVLRSLYDELPHKVYSGGIRGVEVAEFTRAVRRRWRQLHHYVEQEAAVQLVDQGLYRRVQGPWWYLWKTVSRRTPEGDKVQKALGQIVTVDQATLRNRLEQAPQEALAWFHNAGAALLLMDKIYPILVQEGNLGKLVRKGLLLAELPGLAALLEEGPGALDALLSAIDGGVHSADNDVEWGDD